MTSDALFRVDADPQIGLGHLSRCLSLADALAGNGLASTFILRDPDASIRGRINAGGHGVVIMPGETEPGSDADAAFVLDLIRRVTPKPLLVVDHYGIEAHWERQLKPLVSRLAVIDDLANRAHHCDVLIDQNRMFEGAEAYEGLLPSGCIALVGPHYSLLRPEFAELRDGSRKRDGVVRSVVVGFGGSDPTGHTPAVMAALEPHLNAVERVDVLVGPLNRALAQIEEIASHAPQFHVHIAADEVAKLLHGADLAIGAGGVMSWERACLGLPSLVFGIVPNQIHNVRDLLRAGAAMGVSDMPMPQAVTIAKWIDLALTSQDVLRGMGERAAGLVDGLGSRRVAAHLAPRAVSFRAASVEDSAMIHAWRNHPDIRTVSLGQDEIAWDDHDRWFARALANPDRIMLVAQAEGRDVGVVRFDLSGRMATISVYKAPDYTGAINLVGQATGWLFDNRREIDDIEAVVLAGNHRSIQAFATAGYELRERRLVATRAALSRQGL